ncbi:hypothetical protein HSBAA_63660 [Vreelandella sulfidaeris]|uniref:UDP-glucose 4-epimerase n=1 Tax=Vreelandella sulfidaeris TaxID=115553 RepID=A0A455UFS8_9GAMM|nr:hypothetical protein HSBAA_63660 [Halomonas sulfidaeris]
MRRVEEIAGRTLSFIEGDIRDRACLDQLFKEHDIHAVIHFASLKAVGESVAQPLAYYDTNVAGTVTLCKAMQQAGVFVWCSVRRQLSMGLTHRCLTKKACHVAAPPTLTALLNQWWSKPLRIWFRATGAGR